MMRHIQLHDAVGTYAMLIFIAADIRHAYLRQYADVAKSQRHHR